jgi:Dyp-type peroxidase family
MVARPRPRASRQRAPKARAPEQREPLLDIHDIQGNILAGFSKDRQLLIALRLRDPVAARAWVGRIAPHISSMAEVAQFNALFRARRRRLGRDPAGLIATWANIAFSHPGLAALTSKADADGVPDLPFREGLPARAALLGDRSPSGGSDPTEGWVIGGTDRVPDVLLIVASDDESQLRHVAGQLRPGAGDLVGAPEVIWEEMGETRPDLPGHEHFGFKDGVSQPGVRGLVSETPDVFFTPRLLVAAPQGEVEFASPGVPLVWPGQFVFGYPSTNGASGANGGPIPAMALSPAWLKNGSLLVFRRLRQDVAGFHRFLRAAAAALAATPAFPGMKSDRLGALLVGRWPSGAPVARTPDKDVDKDDQNLAKPPAANDFLFKVDTPKPDFRPGAGTPDSFPRAKADEPGFICPRASHIRKVNPRDHGDNFGDQFDVLMRRILRRGAPYGPPLPVPPGGQLPADDGVDRGLHFLCYQTSIQEQFEILQQDWANSQDNPKKGGHDIVIGQTPDATRQAELLTAQGGQQVIQAERQFVTATGGGYFFAPSISAIQDVLARQ